MNKIQGSCESISSLKNHTLIHSKKGFIMSHRWKSILLGARMIFVLIRGFIVYRFFRLSIWGTITMILQKPYLCAACGRRLLKKIGPSGFFWGCSHYPDCQKTFSDRDGRPYIRKIIDLSCPKCQDGTLIKYKRFKKNLWICTNNLSCDYSSGKLGKTKTETTLK